ncbi:MAG: ferredoxin family protein [Deltaproteobacteria bacterium]|nr:ferredoxin family protein [Deltaproteobacteria bacterium]
MPIERIDPDLCTGCELCDESCPMDVIYMVKETNSAYPKYPEDCVSCYICERICPVKAIYVSPQRGRPVPHAW